MKSFRLFAAAILWLVLVAAIGYEQLRDEWFFRFSGGRHPPYGTMVAGRHPGLSVMEAQGYLLGRDSENQLGRCVGYSTVPSLSKEQIEFFCHCYFKRLMAVIGNDSALLQGQNHRLRQRTPYEIIVPERRRCIRLMAENSLLK